MKTAVLLMAHGSPDSPDQMEEYLRRVMAPRVPKPEFVGEMAERYRKIGGRSPLLEITRAQAHALASRIGLPVYVGMRHWHPLIREAVEEVRRDGARKIVGLALAPQYCPVSVGAYHRALIDSREDLEVVLVGSWATEPGLLDCWAARLRPGANVLFTAHSVPVDQAGPYPQEVRETIRGILDRVEVRAHFAWQSRSPSPNPWLGPEIQEILPSLKGQEVTVAPIGFVAEHVETLYDLDILHRAQAERLGIRWKRVAMPNADPMLIEAMASALKFHLS